MMLKQRMASAVLATVLTFSLSATALAHDGWSQTNAPIIAQGEVSYIDLLLGNHSNEHKSYRIAGQWSTESTKVYVTTPAGDKADITSTRFYTGEPATDTAPALNNGFVATFSASSPGAYIISVEGDSVFKHGEVATRTLRSAKSFVAVSDIPVLERVAGLKGFSKAVNPDRAELVPLFNPAAVKPDQQVSVQLLMKGQPLADTKVSLIRRSDNTNPQTFTTDAQGKVSFATGPADYYLLRAKPTTDESKEGEYSSTNYEATMTFTVQNGIAKLPVTNVNSQPYVYVDGKRVESADARIVNGTTQADAALIKRYIDPAYEGTGSAGLRAAAEEQGATVEFLPAVGDMRAAVLIYN